MLYSTRSKLIAGFLGVSLLVAAVSLFVMSGYSTDDTIREALELGAATFIAKPFTPDELADTVRSVLKPREKEERHADEKSSGH